MSTLSDLSREIETLQADLGRIGRDVLDVRNAIVAGRRSIVAARAAGRDLPGRARTEQALNVADQELHAAVRAIDALEDARRAGRAAGDAWLAEHAASGNGNVVG